MKLLVLTNNPERASFRQRILVYLDTLRANGIDCEVAKLPTGSLGRRKLFRQAVEFDGVFLHKKALNPWDAFWLRKYAKKLIYNFDDAIMYSPHRPDRYSPSHFIPFRRTVKISDVVLVGSSYLAEHAKRFNTNVKIIPLGLDVNSYRCDKSTGANGKIRLVWIGSKSTLQYLADIAVALEELGSHFDNLVLRIVADDFFDLRKMHVEKRLWSKDTRGVDLSTCDIGLAPLPDNPFTQGKCSFKVLEYSAAGLPVVASPIGTNSDYVLESVTGSFARSNSDWVELTSRLVKNKNLRDKMGQAGRNHATSFDVSIIGKRFAELIEECLQDPTL